MLRLLRCPTKDSVFVPIAASELAAVLESAGPDAFMWIDAVAPTDEEVEALEATFNWHRLITEDLRQSGQRQKAEMFGDLLLVVVHLPRIELRDGTKELLLDEIDAVLGVHWLLTSHEKEDTFSEQGAHAVAGRTDLDEHGSLAAMTALLDRLVDRYEELVDHLTEAVEEQDRDLLDERDTDPEPGLRRASRVRHAVLRLRRSTGQLRELVGVLVRRELAAPGSSDDLDLELRDVYDHVIRAHDDLEVLYERLAALADTRLALTAYRQNDITKRLSAWGAILLVPTVVTGWFGMNFRHLSLLGWPSGEWLALGFVVVICGALFTGFRRAGWL